MSGFGIGTSAFSVFDFWWLCEATLSLLTPLRVCGAGFKKQACVMTEDVWWLLARATSKSTLDRGRATQSYFTPSVCATGR